MPFQVQHKCFESDSEWSEFGMVRVPVKDGLEATRLLCSNCREELILMSPGSFAAARSTTNIPGFILPGHRQ
jgi:hypothetical protein